MNEFDQSGIMEWVGREILPHEGQCRAWLRRTLDPDDLEDVIQEAYCRIAELADVGHIKNGKAYFFTTARMIVLERLRRARIVRIETIAEIDQMRFTWWKKDIDNAHLMAAPIGYEMPVTDLVYSLMPGITVDRIAALVGDQDPDA